MLQTERTTRKGSYWTTMHIPSQYSSSQYSQTCFQCYFWTNLFHYYFYVSFCNSSSALGCLLGKYKRVAAIFLDAIFFFQPCVLVEPVKSNKSGTIVCIQINPILIFLKPRENILIFLVHWPESCHHLPANFWSWKFSDS